MAVSKVITAIVLFTFIPFILTQEINNASPDETNKLNLTCDDGSSIRIQNFWSDSLYKSCPNRSTWKFVTIMMKIAVSCQLKESCSLDLTNVTMENCTDYKNYLNVKYTCNDTATTTEITTTVKTNDDDPDDDDNDDDDSNERKTTTTTKKPRGRIEPHYLPQPVPGLLTTPKPTERPAHYPQPLLPVPVPKVPVFPTYIRPRPPIFQGLNFNPPPMFMPLPMPMPVPIPLFG